MHRWTQESGPKPNFIVITGIRPFPLYAEHPVQALQILKDRIDQRRYRRKDPDIGVSLLQALDEGRLNFIVMDIERTALLCGELNCLDEHTTHIGEFQETVTWQLAKKLEYLIPPYLMPVR